MPIAFKHHINKLRAQVESRGNILSFKTDLDPDELHAELSIHQEELRAQFDELEHARLRAEALSSELAAVFESMPVGIVIIDGNNSLIQKINSLAIELLEATPDRLHKMLSSYFPYEEFVHDGDYSSFFDWLLASKSDRIEVKMPSGRWLAIRKNRHSDCSLIITLMDITENKSKSIKLDKANALLATFIKDAPVAIAMFDRHMQYLNASEVWRQNFARQDDFIGKCLYEVDFIAENFKDYLRRGLNGEVIVQENDNLITDTGEVLWMDWEIQPWYDEHDHVGGIIIHYENKTGLMRHQAEKIELMQLARDAAEQASYEKSEFLANMSHELRTPMHAINSFAALGIKSSQDEKTKRYFSNIKESSVRLTALLNDLLDLSKLESGDISLVPERLKPLDAVKGCVDSLQPLLDNKQLTVDYQINDTLEAELDPVWFNQLLTNLFSNAIKFSPDQGKLTLSLNQFDWHYAAQGKIPAFKLVLRDEGVGIPAAEVDRVFERFIQSSVTRTGAGGTGLGLPICKRIVEGHKGHIYAQSPPAGFTHGTEIIVEIPLSQAPLGDCSIRKLLDYHQAILADIHRLQQSPDGKLSLPIAMTRSQFCHKGHDKFKQTQTSSQLKTLEAVEQMFHQQAADWIELFKDGATNKAAVVYKSLQQTAQRLQNLLENIEKSELSGEIRDVDLQPLVLLVDDSEIITLTLQSQLEAAGYRVETCNQSVEALEKLVALKPNLLISDIYMPGINGIKLITDALELLPELQVISISGGGESNNYKVLQDAKLAGASAVMSKPVKRDQLLQLVDELIG